MRAKAPRTIKLAKRLSWQKYVSKINSRRAMKTIWNMLRKMNGKKNSLNHIKTNDKTYETKKEIVVLGEAFQQSSSSANYNKSFQNLKNEEEKTRLNLNSNNTDNNEINNLAFIIPELMESLQNAHDSVTGPDEIHYQILKHLPTKSLNILLEILNVIWKRGIFPKCWTEAIVIPVPKPNKDHTEPTNYRPIAFALSQKTRRPLFCYFYPCNNHQELREKQVQDYCY